MLARFRVQVHHVHNEKWLGLGLYGLQRFLNLMSPRLGNSPAIPSLLFGAFRTGCVTICIHIYDHVSWRHRETERERREREGEARRGERDMYIQGERETFT